MFSDRIAKLRKERGLTQKDLAAKLGVSVDSIRRWEQDKRLPDVDMLSKIAHALSTTVSYISGETDEVEAKYSDSPEIKTINTDIDSSMSFVKRGDFIGSGRVLFYHGDDGKQFVIPATAENQAWFREVMGNAISARAVTHS